MDIRELYSDEYCNTTYKHLMCNNCNRSNNCNRKCTLDIKRYYTRYNNDNVPTVCYKCKEYTSQFKIPSPKTYLNW